jgi:hypothetical protein
MEGAVAGGGGGGTGNLEGGGELDNFQGRGGLEELVEGEDDELHGLAPPSLNHRHAFLRHRHPPAPPQPRHPNPNHQHCVRHVRKR